MENNSFPSSAAAAAAAAATTTTDANTTTTNSNSTTTNSNNNTAAATAAAQQPPNSQFQNSLRSLNKSSYKIFKPPARNPNPNPSNPSPNPPPSNPNLNPNPNPNPSPQSQPPVYNIDKSDFREIVQKLTGSPAHRPPPAPSSSSSSSTVAPPPPPPAPTTTSRLHRIRPPPLFNLSHVVGPPPAEVWARPALSPLPPLPTVSGAAESPITAYMRRLRGGPSPTAVAPPLSPLGFGCSGMMLSPSLLMPTSPRMPLPSPR